MSITQENIENVTFGRMAKLLEYVGTGPVNDLVKGELLALLEDFDSEAINWQPSR